MIRLFCGCPLDSGCDGRHETAYTLGHPDVQGERARICPACGLNDAAPGDRYCSDCGSARDRSAWAE